MLNGIFDPDIESYKGLEESLYDDLKKDLDEILNNYINNDIPFHSNYGWETSEVVKCMKDIQELTLSHVWKKFGKEIPSMRKHPKINE